MRGYWNMFLEVNKKYLISLKIGQNILTYTCTILEVDEHFFSFIDKFGKKFTYNKNLIISTEEIENE